MARVLEENDTDLFGEPYYEIQRLEQRMRLSREMEIRQEQTRAMLRAHEADVRSRPPMNRAQFYEENEVDFE